MYKGRKFSGGEGGGGGDFKKVCLGLCCLSPSILTLFKAKCIKIAILFKTLNSVMEYFFRIEDPINVYHAERHIPSEPNMEVPSPERVCPSGPIFHIWRRRNNAFVNDDISSRHHDQFRLRA